MLKGEHEPTGVALTGGLLIVNNALNEVLNGIGLDDQEFWLRIGATRDEARRLLDWV